MESLKSSTLSKLIFSLGLFASACVSSQATSIATSLVGSDNPPSAHTGSAFDASTGKYYRRNYFSTGVLVYNNQADFEANVNSTALALGSGGTEGTYFAVMNGKIYSRSDNVSNLVSVWDATSGTKLSSTSVSTMNGVNGGGTFNWGGYSGMNFMDDSSSLYLFGKSASSSGWLIDKMDANLNVLSSLSYSPSALGYAFIMNGTLFSAAYFSDTTITRSINLSTGLETAVNFNLTGLTSSGGAYLTNFDYVGSTDSLYIHNVNDGKMYEVSNASVAFGVPASTVPDTSSTIALLGLMVVGLASVRRKFVRA